MNTEEELEHLIGRIDALEILCSTLFTRSVNNDPASIEGIVKIFRASVSSHQSQTPHVEGANVTLTNIADLLEQRVESKI